MFRNKEFQRGFLWMLIIFTITICFTIFCPKWSILAVISAMIIIVSLYTLSFYNTYQNIRTLSELLREVQYTAVSLPLNIPEDGELGVLRSELYKVVLKLQMQTELLNKDKNYLSDAISDISHQLKTPLTSMNMMVELLKDEHLPADKRLHFTASVQKQLERIEWLVSSLLVMSKIDAGTIIMKQEPVAVRNLLVQASSHLLIPMELKNIKLDMDAVSKDISYTGDFKWSSEAISNVLKNCLEHSHEHGAIITVSCAQNPVYTVICINDQGDGIASEDLPHVFDRFYKGENASFDSVGIGLSLAKKLITAQNGTICANSTPSKGSTFIIKFYHKTI